MKKSELKFIEHFCKNKDIITKNEIKQFISNHFPDRDIKNIYFYIFDLKRSNIIYQLQTNIYKYCGIKKDFTFTNDRFLNELWEKVILEFSCLDICIWQTSEIYNFMNLQPFKNYIFIEVEKFAVIKVYELLKPMYNNIILKSQYINNDYITFNDFNDNVIIVSNLIDKAPVNKNYSTSKIGYNNYYGKITIFPSPKVEKLLVDLYCDKLLMMFNKNGELRNIYENILKLYKVDFTKLLRYAKNRNAEVDIRYYITNNVNFNIDRGEFDDQQN